MFVASGVVRRDFCGERSRGVGRAYMLHSSLGTTSSRSQQYFNLISAAKRRAYFFGKRKGNKNLDYRRLPVGESCLLVPQDSQFFACPGGMGSIDRWS